MAPSKVFLWSTTIYTNSLEARPYVDDLPCDAASVRRRSVAVILFRGVRRCAAADLELNDDLDPISAQDKPVLGNLDTFCPSRLISFSTNPYLCPTSPKRGVWVAIETH